MGKLHIYALGIHTGGGKLLLQELLSSAKADEIGYVYLDQRISLPKETESKFSSLKYKASVTEQIKAQNNLRLQHKKDDHILFFSNLPSFGKFECATTIFMQNELILSGKDAKHTGLRQLLKLNAKNADRFIVQTESMKKKLSKIVKNPIEVSSLMPKLKTNFTHEGLKPNDFIYVASLSKNKNHDRLLEAWTYLAENDLFPSLKLVISGENNLDFILKVQELKNKYNLKITVNENLSHNDTLYEMSKSQCLVYPSLNESYGMPLVEAHALGLNIIGSDLEYLHNIVEPNMAFDPKSAQSIADTVGKFFTLKKKPKPGKLKNLPLTGRGFIEDNFLDHKIATKKTS